MIVSQVPVDCYFDMLEDISCAAGSLAASISKCQTADIHIELSLSVIQLTQLSTNLESRFEPSVKLSKLTPRTVPLIAGTLLAASTS